MSRSKKPKSTRIRFESTSESETTYYTEEEEEEEEEEKEEERKKKKIHLNKYPAQQSNFLHVSRSRFAIIVGIGLGLLLVFFIMTVGVITLLLQNKTKPVYAKLVPENQPNYEDYSFDENLWLLRGVTEGIEYE